MQTSDVILGLLIILLVGWTMLIAIEQRGVRVSLNALSVMQAGQAIRVSPEKCKQVAGHRLVKAAELRQEEYYTTVGFDTDLNQSFFCFYESG